jgi:hypothetical protein
MAENCGLREEHEQREITNGATGTTGRGEEEEEEEWNVDHFMNLLDFVKTG